MISIYTAVKPRLKSVSKHNTFQ